MHLRSLKVFCDVVRRHSFSKAAADNAMTQSGASQAVQQLEEHLQVRLIDRSKRPFLLTPEGEAFHAGLLPLLRQLESLEAEVRNLGHDVCGQVSVAAIYSVGLSYLAELREAVKKSYPQAEVRFLLGQPAEVTKLVEQGVVDFGLISFPENSTGLTTQVWRDELMLLVAPAGHPLAASTLVQPNDLKDAEFICFAPHLKIRKAIDDCLGQVDLRIEPSAELDNIDSVKHAMEVSNGLAFLPEATIKAELANGSLIKLACPWFNLWRPLGLVQRKNIALGNTARCVMNVIIECGKDEPQTELQNASLSSAKS